MSDPVVRFEKSGAVGSIILDRPPANSYDMAFMQDLDAAIDAANADAETRVAVISSASEKFFSGGADIKAFLANDTAANMKVIETAHSALSKMADSAKVFIAAIAGHAMGGGLEIALAADLRYASEGKYRMGLPEATLGLLPGNGGTQRLPRLIGASKALELMLTGRALTPEEAADVGIVNQVFPADSFTEQVQKLAGSLARGAGLAQGQIKKAVYQGIAMPLEEALAYERGMVAPLFDSEDAKEGLNAFVEKRRAEFKGR